MAFAFSVLAACAAIAQKESEKTSANFLPGHSMHGEAFDEGPRQAAYLIGGTGKVRFSINTTTPLAQRFFEQGLGQLHGFWYWEAERSFRQAAAIDSDCAMAYWGMAMANVNNSRRARKFILEAVKRTDQASRRDAAYIHALSEYYEDWDKEDKDGDSRENGETTNSERPPGEARTSTEAEPATSKASSGSPNVESAGKDSQPDAAVDDPKKRTEKSRKEAYLKRLEELIDEFPDDIEAKAFLVYYRWNWKDMLPIDDYNALDSMLENVFHVEPVHPAHHYRIHLWDEKDAQQALTSAALCGQAAPAIAHMWHMPGHIYSKLKRYDDAVYQQEASARVDHLYMMRDRVMPYRIHNYAHNNEWLARNLVHVGRVRDALAVSKNLIEVPRHPKLNSTANRSSAAAFGRQRLFDALVMYELWNDYIRLAETTYLDPDDADDQQVRHIRWLGAAHFAMGNKIQGGEQLTALQTRLAKLKTEQDQAGENAQTKAHQENKNGAEVERAGNDARSAFEARVKAFDKAIAHLQGVQAMAGDPKSALGLFEKAGDLPKPHLARAYLRAGDKDNAEKLAREAVDAAKNEVYPLATLVEVLYAVGKKEEARKAFDDLRPLAGRSDLNVPIFDRLADVAAALDYPPDWRIPLKSAADGGARPQLSSLGPFRWQPLPAVRWTLAGADGELVSLDDYAGKPVVVIFYLGYGCLHCVEQFNVFLPLAEDYRAAGISILAISTDSVADLKKSVGSLKGSGFGVQGSGEGSQASGVSGQEAKEPSISPSLGLKNTDQSNQPGAASQGRAIESPSQFPFTLVSNDDLRAFKAYKCFDDFEQRPLHGTFLIDKDGLVRWQEIGPEPFKDAAFLLKEAKRLTALPR